MNIKIRIEELRLSFGKAEILKGINIDVYKNKITGFMGPAGSGKSTLISLINRMIDFEENAEITGRVSIDGEDILGDKIDEVHLRRRVGTVFAVPIPLPRSIFDNIAYGPRLKNRNERKELCHLLWRV